MHPKNWLKPTASTGCRCAASPYGTSISSICHVAFAAEDLELALIVAEDEDLAVANSALLTVSSRDWAHRDGVDRTDHVGLGDGGFGGKRVDGNRGGWFGPAIAVRRAGTWLRRALGRGLRWRQVYDDAQSNGCGLFGSPRLLFFPRACVFCAQPVFVADCLRFDFGFGLAMLDLMLVDPP